VAIGVIRSGYEGRDGLAFAVAIDHARSVVTGRPSPTPSVAADGSAYQALAPALPSPNDQRRIDGTHAFEQGIEQLARRSDGLENSWRSFKRACYEGRVVGSFDREWFALWEPRALPGVVSPVCGTAFGDLRRAASAIRDDVLALGETARQADVFPGTRRDILHKYRLDYAGWER
jgi:hypothetical protein